MFFCQNSISNDNTDEFSKSTGSLKQEVIIQKNSYRWSALCCFMFGACGRSVFAGLTINIYIDPPVDNICSAASDSCSCKSFSIEFLSYFSLCIASTKKMHSSCVEIWLKKVWTSSFSHVKYFFYFHLAIQNLTNFLYFKQEKN